MVKNILTVNRLAHATNDTIPKLTTMCRALSYTVKSRAHIT